jgi:outer membrane cobalamin receptor
MNALQGKINGVQISSSGGPGDAPRVIIRGVTTTNGSDPLYVVDGMPVGTNINFLSQNDIESIEVLRVKPFDEYGSPIEIINHFGNKQHYLEAVKELENELYRKA